MIINSVKLTKLSATRFITRIKLSLAARVYQRKSQIPAYCACWQQRMPLYEVYHSNENVIRAYLAVNKQDIRNHTANLPVGDTTNLTREKGCLHPLREVTAGLQVTSSSVSIKSKVIKHTTDRYDISLTLSALDDVPMKRPANLFLIL